MKPWMAAVLALVNLASAQTSSRAPASNAERIRQADVEQTIGYLAADAMAGRDSPSPQLSAAAAYIAERFRAAGLVPGAGDQSFLQRFHLPGLRLDPSSLEVTVHTASGDTKLEPGRDVRLLRAGAAYSAERVEPSRPGHRKRGPLLIEMAETSAAWKALAGPRTVLGSRRRRTPWLLVRAGLLPHAQFAVSVRLPAPPAVEAELANVVGVLPGARTPAEYVMFSAHYDHIGVGMPVAGDSIYNGADDDASGTTAVILLAEALASRRQKLPRSIVFVCFAAEEKGLRGSRAFAAAPPIPLAAIAADVNIEMIGRPPPGGRMAAWVTGSELSDFAAIICPALRRAGVRCIDFPQASMLFGASDNFSLARQGVVAHSISAGSLHADYHRPSDEVGKLDLQHMTAVIGGLYEVGVELATRKERPRYNERGKRRIGRSHRRR